MKWLLIALLALFLLFGGFLLTPSPVDSKAWQAPKPPPMTGAYVPNGYLRQAELLAKGQVYGPEDTTVGADGVLTPEPRMARSFACSRTAGWMTGSKPVADHWVW